jgi:hypothetical protein
MRPGQIRDAMISAGKVGKNLAPGRISQGRESAVQSGGGMLNHLVKYYPASWAMQIK